jgi:hypothetical protein
MRVLGQILLICLVISALQGAVAVLAIAIMLILLWGLFFRTEQTVGLMVLGLLLSALQFHPWITIGALITLAGAVLIARVVEPSDVSDAPPIALPPPEHDPDSL